MVVEVLMLLAEGMEVNAVCRVKGVTADSMRSWLTKASDHVEEIRVYLQAEMHLTQCQIDEFWSFILKKANLSEEELFLEDRGDRWSFVNVLPDSGFIQTIHHGKRTSEEADSFVAAIQANSDGEAPLFLSDGWSGYEDILKKYYCSWQPVPYSGRGRPCNPLQIVDPNLKYAQGIKRKENGKLVDIEKRVILGEEKEILDIIQAGGRAKTINTSYD